MVQMLCQIKEVNGLMEMEMDMGIMRTGYNLMLVLGKQALR